MLVRNLLVLIAAMLAFVHPACAHDIGAMLISVKVSSVQSDAGGSSAANGLRYLGSIRVDLSHLPPAAQSVGALRSGVDSPERRRASSAMKEMLESRSELRFDDAPSAIHLSDGTFTSDGLLEFTFQGAVPQNARTLEWSSTAPPGQYLWRATPPGTADEQTQWLKPGERSDALELRINPTSSDAAVSIDGSSVQPQRTPLALASTVTMYVTLGFTHILPDGLDHILFVLGLLILSPRLKPVLMQATAFTVAHTLTLGLAASGLFHAPSAWVEPMIAISIAFIGIENIVLREFSSRRLGVAFGFGLLHGLGFASALQEIGLPPGRFGVALLSFNVGVEAGQMAVILAAFGAIGVWTRNKSWYRPCIAVPASVAISCVALVWTVQRIAG